MKISQLMNEDALDVLADLIEPMTEILSDAEVRDAWNAPNTTRAKVAKIAIKKHKSAIIDALAAIDGVPREEYKCNVLTLPLKVIEILNDKDLISFFGSAGHEKETASFGEATGSTTAKEE